MKRFSTTAFVAALVFSAEDRLFGQDGKAPEQAPQVRLKYAAAADVVAALSPVFKGKDWGVELVAEPVSNTVLVSAPLEKREHLLRLIAEFDALSNVKQYVIAVRVCQGDPLADKGEITVLSRPTLLVLQGQSGTVRIGKAIDGFDGVTEDYVGIAVHFRPRGEKDGVIQIEFGARIAELVHQTKDGHEVRTWSARQQREVRLGETFRMRLKGSSASEQTWVEATLAEATQNK